MDFKTGMENILNQPIAYTVPAPPSIAQPTIPTIPVPTPQVPVPISNPVLSPKLQTVQQSNKSSSLLIIGIIVCVLGFVFALYMYNKIKKQQIKESE
jgi:hypothetical protein